MSLKIGDLAEYRIDAKLFDKQIVQHNLVQNVVCVTIALQAKSCNHNRPYSFPCIGFRFENADFVTNSGIVLFGDFVLALRKFYFAKIYNIIVAVD